MPAIVCYGCDERLTEASKAIRHHSSVMHTAIQLTQSDVTEEQRKDFVDSLVASFDEAQSAWDAYRQHLIEHGLLPAGQ